MTDTDHSVLFNQLIGAVKAVESLEKLQLLISATAPSVLDGAAMYYTTVKNKLSEFDVGNDFKQAVLNSVLHNLPLEAFVKYPKLGDRFSELMEQKL